VPLPGAVPPQYLDRLARAFQSGSDGAAPSTTGDTSAVAALVDPLSDRELEVLDLLAAGRSDQQIADELVVVLDTVKKHVGHILDKLGAANRTRRSPAPGHWAAAVAASGRAHRSVPSGTRDKLPPQDPLSGDASHPSAH
jgi:DNA-binding CsgD family transcriptional regulator